jgi:hypothetical protein
MDWATGYWTNFCFIFDGIIGILSLGLLDGWFSSNNMGYRVKRSIDRWKKGKIKNGE